MYFEYERGAEEVHRHDLYKYYNIAPICNKAITTGRH